MPLVFRKSYYYVQDIVRISMIIPQILPPTPQPHIVNYPELGGHMKVVSDLSVLGWK